MDNCLPEEGNCTFISLTFPIAEKGSDGAAIINEKIHNLLVRTIDYQEDTIVKNTETLAANFIRDYKETISEFPEYELPWEATINGKVNYQSSEIVSLKFNTNMFTGGAHGYRSIDYLNFDAKTGELLNTDDLFKTGFAEYIEKDFREKKEIPLDANINSTGMLFKNDEFQLPKNIGFTEDSVTLYYNTYEIAPYSDGTFEFTYPKEEIEKFLKYKK